MCVCVYVWQPKIKIVSELLIGCSMSAEQLISHMQNAGEAGTRQITAQILSGSFNAGALTLDTLKANNWLVWLLLFGIVVVVISIIWKNWLRYRKQAQQ